MNENTQAFIERLASMSPALHASFNDTIEYWRPETPPVTIVFGALGESVIENFEAFGSDRLQDIMMMIEQGINSADDELSTAVATGFIEAMVARESKIEGGLRAMLLVFGKASRAHAEAWANA